MTNLRKIAVLFGLTVCSATLVAALLMKHREPIQSSATKPTKQSTPPKAFSAYASPEEVARLAKLNGLSQAAQEAEAKGDYAEAEADLRTWIATNFDNPLNYSVLAQFYDRRGRDQEAYASWKKVLYADPKKGASSLQDDPAVLARFGELARRYGTVQEARIAYTKASSKAAELTMIRMPKVPFEPLQKELAEAGGLSDKVTVGPAGPSLPGTQTIRHERANPSQTASIANQMPMEDLRATALYTAALWLDGHGDRKPAITYIRSVVEAQPQWALGHLVAGMLFSNSALAKESATEYARAEKLANPEMRSFIHKERTRLGYIDASGKQTIG